ncbi:MAG: ankyrin repeat domain-containing protein [Chthonomonadales bacterium]
MTLGKFIAGIFAGAWIIGIIIFLILSPSFRAGKALLKAAEAGDTQTATTLLNSGASLINRDREGHSALWLAAYKGNVNILKALVHHHADVNARGQDGWTPLMWAVMNDRADVVKVLVDAGANVNAVGNNGETAQEYAKDKPEILAMLKNAPPKK